MNKSPLRNAHSNTWRSSQLVLLAVLTFASAGCVDVRSAAHSTAGFLAGDSSRASAREQPRSQPPGPAPELVGYVTPEITIELAQEPGQVSASGLAWIVLPSGQEARPVRDLPEETSEIVGSLANWESDFWVAERTRNTTAGKWRRVTLDDGTAGWIEAKYLVAQPAAMTTKDKKAIRAIVEAGVQGVKTYVGPLPRSAHQVIADVEGVETVLLLDWSDRELKLSGIFDSLPVK